MQLYAIKRNEIYKWVKGRVQKIGLKLNKKNQDFKFHKIWPGDLLVLPELVLWIPELPLVILGSALSSLNLPTGSPCRPVVATKHRQSGPQRSGWLVLASGEMGSDWLILGISWELLDHNYISTAFIISSLIFMICLNFRSWLKAMEPDELERCMAMKDRCTDIMIASHGVKSILTTRTCIQVV